MAGARTLKFILVPDMATPGEFDIADASTAMLVARRIKLSEDLWGGLREQVNAFDFKWLSEDPGRGYAEAYAGASELSADILRSATARGIIIGKRPGASLCGFQRSASLVRICAPRLTLSSAFSPALSPSTCASAGGGAAAPAAGVGGGEFLGGRPDMMATCPCPFPRARACSRPVCRPSRTPFASSSCSAAGGPGGQRRRDDTGSAR
jgi:hypothetical protein